VPPSGEIPKGVPPHPLAREVSGEWVTSPVDIKAIPAVVLGITSLHNLHSFKNHQPTAFKIIFSPSTPSPAYLSSKNILFEDIAKN
jgi:hypothetical protein